MQSTAAFVFVEGSTRNWGESCDVEANICDSAFPHCGAPLQRSEIAAALGSSVSAELQSPAHTVPAQLQLRCLVLTLGMNLCKIKTWAACWELSSEYLERSRGKAHEALPSPQHSCKGLVLVVLLLRGNAIKRVSAALEFCQQCLLACSPLPGTSCVQVQLLNEGPRSFCSLR